MRQRAEIEAVIAGRTLCDELRDVAEGSGPAGAYSDQDEAGRIRAPRAAADVDSVDGTVHAGGGGDRILDAGCLSHFDAVRGGVSPRDRTTRAVNRSPGRIASAG